MAVITEAVDAGQIELYSHIPVLPRLARLLTQQLNINLVCAYLIESQFMEDPTKYFSGVMSAMSCMIALEVPAVNIMSKMDLVRHGTVTNKRRREVDRCVCSNSLLSWLWHSELTVSRPRFLDPDPELLREDANASTNPKFHALNKAIVQLVRTHPSPHPTPR